MLRFQADAVSLLSLIEWFGIWRLWAATISSTAEGNKQAARSGFLSEERRVSEVQNHRMISTFKPAIEYPKRQVRPS